MKISNQGVRPGYQTNPTPSVDPQTPKPGSQGEFVSQDSAEVSEVGQFVSQIENQSAAKVEQLRAKFADGAYSVNADALSSKLVDSMLDK